MLAQKYLEKGFKLLTQLHDSQVGNIEHAAEIIAQAVTGGHTFYTWGGPHSCPDRLVCPAERGMNTLEDEGQKWMNAAGGNVHPITALHKS